MEAAEEVVEYVMQECTVVVLHWSLRELRHNHLGGLTPTSGLERVGRPPRVRVRGIPDALRRRRDVPDGSW